MKRGIAILLNINLYIIYILYNAQSLSLSLSLYSFPLKKKKFLTNVSPDNQLKPIYCVKLIYLEFHALRPSCMHFSLNNSQQDRNQPRENERNKQNPRNNLLLPCKTLPGKKMFYVYDLLLDLRPYKSNF